MEPKCIETRVHRGGDGKVAIMDYGKVSSGYSANVTRSYVLPDDWDDAQITEFENTQLGVLKERIDEVLDAEFKERWNQKVWSE